MLPDHVWKDEIDGQGTAKRQSGNEEAQVYQDQAAAGTGVTIRRRHGEVPWRWQETLNSLPGETTLSMVGAIARLPVSVNK